MTAQHEVESTGRSSAFTDRYHRQALSYQGVRNVTLFVVCMRQCQGLHSSQNHF
jgi:hypothetical protein